jgi:hypothetical protein
MNVHAAVHISKAMMVRGMIGNIRCSYGGMKVLPLSAKGHPSAD